LNKSRLLPLTQASILCRLRSLETKRVLHPVGSQLPLDVFDYLPVYSVIGFSDNGGCCFHVWLSEVDARGPVDQLHDAV